jgi:hypothetical protein
MKKGGSQSFADFAVRVGFALLLDVDAEAAATGVGACSAPTFSTRDGATTAIGFTTGASDEVRRSEETTAGWGDACCPTEDD